jgi:hypothetical protein
MLGKQAITEEEKISKMQKLRNSIKFKILLIWTYLDA